MNDKLLEILLHLFLICVYVIGPFLFLSLCKKFWRFYANFYSKLFGLDKEDCILFVLFTFVATLIFVIVSLVKICEIIKSLF